MGGKGKRRAIFCAFLICALIPMSFAACSAGLDLTVGGGGSNKTAPEAPKEVTVSGGGEVSWQPSGGAEKYIIECGGSVWESAGLSSGLPELPAGEYTVKVRAAGGSGLSDKAKYTFTVTALTVPEIYWSGGAPHISGVENAAAITAEITISGNLTTQTLPAEGGVIEISGACSVRAKSESGSIFFVPSEYSASAEVRENGAVQYGVNNSEVTFGGGNAALSLTVNGAPDSAVYSNGEYFYGFTDAGLYNFSAFFAGGDFLLSGAESAFSVFNGLNITDTSVTAAGIFTFRLSAAAAVKLEINGTGAGVYNLTESAVIDLTAHNLKKNAEHIIRLTPLAAACADYTVNAAAASFCIYITAAGAYSIIG